jgi:MFS family permease
MDNIKKIYAFNFFWLFSVLLPVLYPYYATLGVNMQQFFQLQAAFGLTVALLDVPTGFLSDRFGRKKSIVAAGFLTGVAYVVLLYSTSFGWLLCHEIILGMALSFLSGADIALLYESLPAQGSRKQLWQVLGRSQLAYAAGESSGAILCGFIVMYSYRDVLLTQLVISWLPFLVALTLSEPRKATSPAYDWANIRKMWRHLLKDDSFIRLLSWNFILWTLSTYVVIWMVQRFWHDRDVPIAYFGLLWAGYNLTMGLSAYFSHTLEKKFRAAELVHAIALFCVLGYLCMSLFEGWWGLAAALLIYAGRGINNVVSRDILNLRVPSELRATANSILNFLFRVLFALIGPAIGFSIDRVGMNLTLMGLGVVFLLGYMFITRPLLKMLKDV